VKRFALSKFCGNTKLCVPDISLCTSCTERKAGGARKKRLEKEFELKYSAEKERSVKYKRGKNHCEISISSRKITKFTMSRSKYRPSTSRIWRTILVIVRIALEVATRLVGSGKRRKLRLLPEPII
jgi:hypothetical protein